MNYLIGMVVALVVLMIYHCYTMHRLNQISKFEKKAVEVSIMVEDTMYIIKNWEMEANSIIIKNNFYKINVSKNNKVNTLKELMCIVKEVILLYEKIGDRYVYSLDEDERCFILELNNEMRNFHRQLKLELWKENGI